MVSWLRKNVGLILSVCALASLISSYAAGLIPDYATAADLEQLSDTVQQTNDSVQKMHETYNRDTKKHDIKHLQDQIAAVKLQFMSAGRPLTPEAEFYIEQKEIEIQDLKDEE